MKYLSFLSGVYTTTPGLSSASKAEGTEKYVFQIDDNYAAYLANKTRCRDENIRKYYFEYQLSGNTISEVNRFIVRQLISDYPEQFSLSLIEGHHRLINHKNQQQLTWADDFVSVDGSTYLSLFDALCSQLQEDIAVVQLGEEDYLSAIHLCSPNHWSPSDKIGKPFYVVHAPVPSMERTIQNYKKMLSSIASSSTPSTRFAWGIATDTRLNHHPDAPPGLDASDWRGRHHSKDSVWYVRSERQNLVGFPSVNAFMFTIRTYHYAVDELTEFEKSKLAAALKTMTPQTLQYKGLEHSVDILLHKLEGA